MEESLIETVKDRLIGEFGEDIISFEILYDFPTFTVNKKVIRNVICFLREDKLLGFTFLTDLCGIHFPDEEKQLGVIYRLHNLVKNWRIVVKTYTTIDDPKVDSITPIFRGANWMERETYDFFGVEFVDHPNLKRILNVDYTIDFPLRKEFPLEDPDRKDKDDRMFGRK